MKRFALVGNPNCGKTTLFNVLTGSTAHVGNWPGVTVDKKEGVYKVGEESVSIVDLPGIYSLSPYTPEEVVSRNYILDEKPECVINIVDATNLERNLYLTTQVMEIDVPVVVALNMMDVVEKEGGDIDQEELEKRLGLPVVKISAVKGVGVKELMQRAITACESGRKAKTVLENCDLAHLIGDVNIALQGREIDNTLFHAIKLVENDELEVKMHPKTVKMVEDFKGSFHDSLFGTDFEAIIADARYKYITKFYSPLMNKNKPQGLQITVSDKVDRVLTNKWLGIPMFLVILFFMFHLTFSKNFLFLGVLLPDEWISFSGTIFEGLIGSGAGIVSPGVFLYNLVDVIISNLSNLIMLGVNSISGMTASVSSFIEEGVLGGVGAVLSFVPQILILLLLMSILEDSGYMARVAFILDKIFRKFGVSGRAFIPMIMGFGCSVPAIINTRTLADERERTLTIRVIPFFTCGAKLPILLAISGAIVSVFGNFPADIIVYSMYVFGMILAVVTVLIMRSTTQRGEIAPFIMELPAYHLPSFRSLMAHMWDKLKHYVEKAFTIILLSTIIIWFLSNFNWQWEFLIKEYVQTDGGLMLLSQYETLIGTPDPNLIIVANVNIDKSILGSIGSFIQPLFTPLGFGSQLGEFGWVFVVSAITGLVAKENVVATFGTIATCLGAGLIASEDGVMEVSAMINAIANSTGASIESLFPMLIAFIVFNMATIPCFASVATARKELGKGRKTKLTLLFWLVTSYVSASIVYLVLSWWWTAIVFIVLAIFIVVFIKKYNIKHPVKG